MIRELPQLQRVSHTQDLPPEQKRRLVCFGEKVANRGSAKRSNELNESNELKYPHQRAAKHHFQPQTGHLKDQETAKAAKARNKPKNSPTN